MKNNISLRIRTISILVLLLLIIVITGLVMVWHTYRLESLFTGLIDINIASLQAVEALENDLANQKGFVSYYFIDGNPDWLNQLETYRQRFKNDLARVRECSFLESDEEVVDQIVAEYERYITAKDQVISLYTAGERETGAKLHQEVRNLYFNTLQMCENYKNIHFEKINVMSYETQAKARHIRMIVVIFMSIAIILTVILEVILSLMIIDPVRKLTLEIKRSNDWEKNGEEIYTLRDEAHCLIKDMEKF